MAKLEFCVLFNALMLIIVQHSASQRVLKERIVIDDGESFMNYLILDQELTSCALNYTNASFELDLNSPTIPQLSYDDRPVETMTSLGRGVCGLVLDYNTRKNRYYTLTATDYQDNTYKGDFYVQVKDPSAKTHVKREEFLGTEVSIRCDNLEPDLKHCSLFEPSGKLVPTENKKTCVYTIRSFTMDHVGIWKCQIGTKLTTSLIEHKIELVNKDIADDGELEKWFFDHDDHYVDIGCRIAKYNKSGVEYCKMTAPDKKVYNLEDFSATDRFLAIGTNLSKAVCSIQIRKPLLESDKGIWLCEIRATQYDISDAFAIISVNYTYNSTVPKHYDLTTRLSQPFTIDCPIPYFTENCNIRAPDGTEYESQSPTRLGKCSLTVEEATFAHHGTWNCSYGQATGLPNAKITYEVRVAENFSRPVPDEVQVIFGHTITLKCDSGGLPLKYCLFISPQKEEYYIKNHDASTNMTYFGKGLEYGECGVQIPNAQSIYGGSWYCVTQLAGDTTYGKLTRWLYVIVHRNGP